MTALLMRCAAAAALVLAMTGHALAAGANFEPTTIVVPIRGIYLGGIDRSLSAEVYRCAGNSEAACRVEVTNDAALAALTTTAGISAGTFEAITVLTCDSEGGYSAQFSGSVNIAGIPYVTSSGPDPLVDNSAGGESPSPVTVPYDGCGKTYPLPTPLVVTSGATVHLSLFISTVDIAWGQIGGTSIPSGCRQNGAGSMEACMAYPEVVPYVGTTTPTFELYHVIRTSGGQGGQMLLILDADGNLLGGFTRPLYQGTILADWGYDTPLRIFYANGDGSYTLANYGSSAENSYLTFPAFRRETHSASYEGQFATSVPYTATRQ